MVLQGGYKDWMRKYPMFTTQAINYDSLVEPRASSIIGDVLGNHIIYFNKLNCFILFLNVAF